MRANKSWLWALFCSILLFWSCAEPDSMLDEEALLSADLTLLSDDLKVSDLLIEGAPEEFQKATGRMLQNGMGEKLLQSIKSISPQKPFISFWAIVDQNGEIIRTYEEVGYLGNGMIAYTYLALKNDYNDELLFQEYFHIYQYGQLVAVKKNRNAEIEAYMAQYIYAKSKGDKSNHAYLLDPTFDFIIRRLALYIDHNTGYFLSSADIDQFCREYNAALDYLAITSKYSGEEWESEPINRDTIPFPNLMRLLNS